MRALTITSRAALAASLTAIVTATVLTAAVSPAEARNPIRRDFFDVYPAAEGTTLDDVPSNPGHCGVCHFDFDGSGPRNPYGLAVEIAISSGEFPNDEAAIFSLHDLDSDNDGFTNGVEITDTVNFSNTPTFPGLKTSNLGQVLNVDITDIQDHLTPSGGTDTTPPTVTVTTPSGGEVYDATSSQTIAWTATDPSGIARVNIFHSDDGGTSFRPVVRNLVGVESYVWFVPNRPGLDNLIRVTAYDGAGNAGDGDSGGAFTIAPLAGGIVATTLRDFDLPGTQPLEAGIFEDSDLACAICHGDYDQAVEPWYNWRGSMMGQAMRDPLFLATMVIAEQDAPASGDLCIRCHTPSGWLEGRSTDTSGGLLIARDRQSIQCDFCHRVVDPIYTPGVSPAADLPILEALDEIPLTHANGQFVTDPDPIRRGPFADAESSHQFLESPVHRESAICGTCHDVSNPVFVAGSQPGEYDVQALDTAHPDADLRNMMPVERTFSEWSVSQYAAEGVYAPEFAGNLPDGIVSTCQDCHMRDVTGQGAHEPGVPVRDNLPLHDLMGGNHFVPDILPDFYPDEVDPAQLQAARQRALDMLVKAATLTLLQVPGPGVPAIAVSVMNETGHKLPSGYPEGRRMWLNVRGYDAQDGLIYESGAYDPGTGVLTHDDDVKIYQIKPGISHRLAAAVGVPAGPSFHFVLNDTIYLDNRIPPRGFTNAAFTAIQSPPIGYGYADGQYADTTGYHLPPGSVRVEVSLNYQSTSKEYIEFLRDENVTDDLGDQLYASWVNQGRAAPVAMATAALVLDTTVSAPADDSPSRATRLLQNTPNPFNPVTLIRFTLAQTGPVSLRIYDERGRLVRTLIASELPMGDHQISWEGRDVAGRSVASGVYHYVLRTADSDLRGKMTLIR